MFTVYCFFYSGIAVCRCCLQQYWSTGTYDTLATEYMFVGLLARSLLARRAYA